MVGHTCASLLPCLLTGTLSQQPTGQLAAINEQAGKERDLSGVGQLQLKSHAGFLGSPSWEILPGHGCQLGTSGHTSPFISDFGTSSHSLLHSQAKSSNDHDQAQQHHLWSTPQSPMTSLGTFTSPHTSDLHTPLYYANQHYPQFLLHPSQPGVAGHTLNLVPVWNCATSSCCLFSAHNLLSFQMTY